VFEDFLDAIGVSLERFRDELSGGWLFGYVEALQFVGVETDLVFVSARVQEPVWWHHRATGARMLILPATRPYGLLRRRLVDPYAWSRRDAVGDQRGIGRAIALIARQAAPYCATPVLDLARTIRRERYDAIVCQEYEYPRFDVCVALGKLLGVPVFATFQGGSVHLTRLEAAVRPRTLRACNGVIIGPRSESERVTRHYGLQDIKIGRIFNPLDLSTWIAPPRPEVRQELGIAPGALVVAWHGRVHLGIKGLDVLCEAWVQLKKAEDGARRYLLLVGTGTDAVKLRRRIAESRLKDVVWLDRYILEHSRLRDLLTIADVYAFPSRREGFPVAPLEAMACGLPVVAADVPGVSDILENGEESGGIIVPREDSGALARAVEKLLGSNELRATLGQRARRRVQAAFSLETVGSQLRDFILQRSSSG
jgi:glycosyltransferase involved in cell wall biosynthesis